MVIRMASKKMGKKMSKDDSCDCNCCCDSGMGGMSEWKVKGWILVILGLLGLLQVTGYINLAPYYFGYVWALIVLIIGLKKVFWSGRC